MIVPIDKNIILRLKKEARKSERRRAIYRFHKKYAEKVQRMVNVMCKDTYARPHAHITPPKIEVFMVLEGRALLVEYTKKGRIKDSMILSCESGVYGVEISPKTIHSVIPLSNIAVFYEIKEGPYDKKKDKNFAEFAPEEENVNEGLKFNKNILKELKIK